MGKLRGKFREKLQERLHDIFLEKLLEKLQEKKSRKNCNCKKNYWIIRGKIEREFSLFLTVIHPNIHPIICLVMCPQISASSYPPLVIRPRLPTSGYLPLAIRLPVIFPAIWCFPIWLTSSLSYLMAIFSVNEIRTFFIVISLVSILNVEWSLLP